MPDIDEGQDVSIRTSRFNPQPYAPYDLVNDRFTTSLELANQMVELLVGTSGDEGYLGVLNDFLNLAGHTYDIEGKVPDVDTTLTVGQIGSPPQFNDALLDDFPDFNVNDPALRPVPTIDLAELELPPEPEDINPQIIWTELIYNQDIYQKLLDRINQDIVNGATGLDSDVEQALFDSGRHRQQRIRDKAYRELNNDIAGRGELVASGATFGTLAELYDGAQAEDSELNRAIIIKQAELAQNNSQFIIDQAAKLEALLRDSRNKDSDRALDYAKAVATLTLQVYAEKGRMYVAIVTAKRTWVEAQVANLNAVVSYNLGLIDLFKAETEAHGIRVQAVGAKNQSLVDVYRGKVDGYSSEASATAAIDGVKLDKIRVELGEADLALRAAIADAEADIKSWGTDYELKAKVSEVMNNIATQALVGALSSVHANASMGYSGSESRSENWSQSKSLSESHNYQEDPAVE